MILDFLKVYWADVAVILIFILVMIVLIKRNQTDVVRKIVFYFVVQAEKALGSKTGEAKYSAVVAEIYARLPLILRILFTHQNINDFIEESVDKLKVMLSDGRVDLLSYTEEIQRMR